jgi:hypothetical protein
MKVLKVSMRSARIVRMRGIGCKRARKCTGADGSSALEADPRSAVVAHADVVFDVAKTRKAVRPNALTEHAEPTAMPATPVPSFPVCSP